MSYCTRTDVEHAWNPADVLTAADDDASGTLSTDEEAHITRAIDQAAEQMNAHLAGQYVLADLTDNLWCRDVNAILAAYFLATRSGDAAPDGLAERATRCFAQLEQIRQGKVTVPGVTSSIADKPQATNFKITYDGFGARVMTKSE
jgi:phage gp36-like protein